MGTATTIISGYVGLPACALTCLWAVMLSDMLRGESAALYSTLSRSVQYSEPPVHMTKMNNSYACMTT